MTTPTGQAPVNAATAVADALWAVRFKSQGCPAVLAEYAGRGRAGRRAAALVRRAVFNTCTAAGRPERCLLGTDRGSARGACVSHCPHLRAGARSWKRAPGRVPEGRRNPWTEAVAVLVAGLREAVGSGVARGGRP